jgi:hypothetical protein
MASDKGLTGGEKKWVGPRPLEPLTVDAVEAAVMTARLKFPGNRFTLAALTEEVGELARALLQKRGTDEVVREAIQVAAIALRIVEEGDASFADVTEEESKS